jgi:hypothetical protein
VKCYHWTWCTSFIVFYSIECCSWFLLLKASISSAVPVTKSLLHIRTTMFQGNYYFLLCFHKHITSGVPKLWQCDVIIIRMAVGTDDCCIADCPLPIHSSWVLACGEFNAEFTSCAGSCLLVGASSLFVPVVTATNNSLIGERFYYTVFRRLDIYCKGGQRS